MIDACKTPPRHLPIRHRSGRSGAVIRVQMIRQDTGNPDKRLRHPSYVSCTVAGRRFEAEGPAPIYRLATLLWLHGHGGADFEVWDDRSPTGRGGGLALRGRVRNWARIVQGQPKFNKDAQPDPDFTPSERDLVARLAGTVSDASETDSPRPAFGHTAATRPSDGSEYPREEDGASTGVRGAQHPEAA